MTPEEELILLRAKVAELERRDNSELAMRMNAGLSRVAASAQREASMYRQMQAGQEPNSTDLTDGALQGANIVLQDMGLI